MDLARDWLAVARPAELPLLVIADEQTAGRGRQGRPWIAPAGSALLMSLAFRPNWLAPEQATALVQLASVALCEAVAAQGIPTGLKWPNDVLAPIAPDAAEWAKVAGILLETQLERSQISSVVIGIGVNISAAPPPDLTRYPATHLQAAAGREISRLALLRALLQRLDVWYGRLAAGNPTELYTAWRARLRTLGQPVTIDLADGVLHGTAEDVDASGALFVRDRAGVLHRVSSGDVGLAQ
jgi:BirA family biotin operon repressor/biotin-[acetyl-CoA-carboxylase] ligase